LTGRNSGNGRRELAGPSPAGQEIDCAQNITFDKNEEAYGPWVQMGTGEEILTRDPPGRRYGVGVLYPMGSPMPEGAEEGDVSGSENGEGETAITEHAMTQAGEIAERTGRDRSLDEGDELDLASANAYRPGSMAASFLVALPEEAKLVVEVNGGRYDRKGVRIAGQEREWWLRRPVRMRAELASAELLAPSSHLVTAITAESTNLDGLNIVVQVLSRPRSEDRQRLLTVCVVNRSAGQGMADEHCLFQAFFKARIDTEGGAGQVLPYPGPAIEAMDEEDASMELVYRNQRTLAVGHGCAANWGIGEGPSELGDLAYARAMDQADWGGAAHADWVSAECLPAVEIPNMTPEITGEDGAPVVVSMQELAGLAPGQDGMSSLERVVGEYEKWIERRQQEVKGLEPALQQIAGENLDACRVAADRMRAGLAFLAADQVARAAFRLANHAILLQQVRYRREARKAAYDDTAQRLQFAGAFTPVDPLVVPPGRGQWRAFQIAFILMAMQSCADGRAVDREVVELIWFPTGGGKTEAYLGLAAFSIFYERLAGQPRPGVHVLMRYTLRLLTAQQFLRASGLICAMEYLRRENAAELGDKEFSIGIWLGGESTPNSNAEALSALAKLQKLEESDDENPFAVERCPWCGAQMGRIKVEVGKGKKKNKSVMVIGYERTGNRVAFRCPDTQCSFASGLPIYVVDEDIYEFKPSMVIGTVDKFAQLAWRPRARALFGVAADGTRQNPPPNLIIQDELHLIAGPLGSMVGLYETLVEELCCDGTGDGRIRPKIISSTATIRRYREQIRALYAREHAALFPPPGLDAADSFFARYGRDADGRLERGRIYTGVHAPGLGSIQTAQVRSISALLQVPVRFDAAERDPWWTLMLFFNSLRELGTTVSLLQSDIPDYLKVLRNRYGLGQGLVRWIDNILELTGRLPSQQVRKAIDQLEVTTEGKGRAIDVCLASSILEVGIDIDRLSLMVVVGQPKTTSQYIQVTGRVGRRTQERPGLIVTIYGASKPRDRSHFEKFRSYHERLYAQVEPTSVTPFSPPALDRALHALMAAFVRQTGSEQAAASPYPYPGDMLEALRELVLQRALVAAPEEQATIEAVFAKRAGQWERWERTHWDDRQSGDDTPLLRTAGAYVTRADERVSWATPISLRNVDAECAGSITRLYIEEEGNENG